MRSFRPQAFRIILLSSLWLLPLPLAQADSAGGTGKGKLYLVGVGPGGADLITLRAVKAIAKADFIICSPGIRERFGHLLEGKRLMCGEFWRLFHFYGLKPAEVPAEQRGAYERITRERAEFIDKVHAALKRGETVAILDNGDPLIYGPYVWCLREFADAKPEVIPGLSCVNAANAALGQSVTGGKGTKSVILTCADWPGTTDTIERLAKPRATMVLFTMQKSFKYFIERLQRGYGPNTPVAVVIHAGDPQRQRVVRGTLGNIIEKVDPDRLPFEYLIYVGDFLATGDPSPR